ncbi:O-antigen ligase [Streptomyces sp. TS71-3]|uniref:O-antigen ligase family protein n=1 Tax=Streptomyces sp. TS71-3 TaxID=2733862 RepID=UPI002017DEE4|nr:O-antigen ligase family protein [Streptomyces sp. TS71-3]
MPARVEADDPRAGADAAGMVALGGCAVWSLVTAAATGGRPEGTLLAVLAVAAGYAGGRIAGALLPVAAPAAGALVAGALMVAAPGTALAPDGPPWFGTAAASAAVWTLCAGGACCAAVAAERTVTRVLLWLLAAVLAVAAALLGSPAGATGALLVLACSATAGRVRRSPGLAALTGVAVVAAAAVWTLAAGDLPPGWQARAGDALGAHRLQLWRDAAALALDHPLLGAGPGRFADLSPTVAAAVPADGRPHSALLQQAAEQGLVGVALLAAGPCWALRTLWRSPGPTPVVLTAASALTVLAGLALAGNALSFTSVTAGAGLLAGVATARPMEGEEGELGVYPV